jgi:hypothetical protein
VRAYEAALAELIRSDPEDSLRFHDLADAPPDEAERGTAEWLAIEYSVIVNLANGRAERPDEEMPAHADEILRLAEGFLQRFRRVDRVAALCAMRTASTCVRPSGSLAASAPSSARDAAARSATGTSSSTSTIGRTSNEATRRQRRRRPSIVRLR